VRFPVFVAAVGLLGACHDSTEPLPPRGDPDALRVLSGDKQHGIAGQELPAPVVVRLLDTGGNPLPDATITFEIVSVGGSISSAGVRTNSSGMAQTLWTLGPTAGEPQILQARLDDSTTGAILLVVTVTATADPASTGLRFETVHAGSYQSCGLTAEGQAYCWGTNFTGVLGNLEPASRFTVPTAVTGGLTFTRIATGLTQTCGLTAEGAAYCWGENADGQLGDGTTSHASAPRPVSGGLAFLEIDAGYYHTCALTASGAAYCWGMNNFNGTGLGGQLGDGTLTDRSTPTAVTGGLTFHQLALGGFFTCGLTSDGAAYCWGDRSPGDGRPGSTVVPTAVLGGLAFTAISAGFSHACGLVADGSAYCWGSNGGGELGNGTLTDVDVPVAVGGGLRFMALSAGSYHTCALTLSGQLACWGWDDGYDDSRAFNDGTSIHSTTPVLVPDELSFVALGEGDDHGCGVTADHVAYCWFDNTSGALGNGTFTGSYLPVAVR